MDDTSLFRLIVIMLPEVSIDRYFDSVIGHMWIRAKQFWYWNLKIHKPRPQDGPLKKT